VVVVPHWVMLVQASHWPVVVLQTRPPFAPTHPAVLQLKPAGATQVPEAVLQTFGASHCALLVQFWHCPLMQTRGAHWLLFVQIAGVTDRVQVPLWQVPIEHSVPFAFARHRHRVLPDLVLCFLRF
jgi:hypothetical protein